MIYVTGDMHGDVSRFKDAAISKLKKNDTLIVTGDFGFIWQGTRAEQTFLKKLGKQKFNVAFVDGCHENFDLLEGYPEGEWYGGRARIISGRLVQLLRGEVYHIEGKEIFTFGGGASSDYDMRIGSNTWYKREQPNSAEIQHGRENLEKFRNKVDYIITHEPPQSLKTLLEVDLNQQLEINAFFEEIVKGTQFKKWFFGKHHFNRHIPPRFYSVFDDLIKLN